MRFETRLPEEWGPGGGEFSESYAATIMGA